MVLCYLLLLSGFIDYIFAASYDYIVIGSGAGGVVASRLAEAHNKVLLIESGPDDLTYSCKMSETCFAMPYGDLIAGTPLLPLKMTPDNYWWPNVNDLKWNATSMPSFWNYNKTILNFTESISRAKMLGGCISHNGQTWTRGSVRDYDFVAVNLSLPSWSFHSVLPYFQKIEKYFGENTSLRGDNGPIHLMLRDLNDWEYGLNAFLNATIKSGLPYNNHQNGGFSQKGVGISEMNTAKYDNGTFGLFNSSYYRSSIAQSYVRDIGLKSGYLTVWYNTTVQRIIFNKETPIKAIGVEYYESNDNNSLNSIYCNKEIILSGGVYQSPQILMLSGIGPIDELNRFNITPIYINNNIGRYGQDHMYLLMDYKYNLSSINATKQRPKDKVIINMYNKTEYFDFMGQLQVYTSSNTYDRLGYNYNDIRLQVLNGDINNNILRVMIDPGVYSKNLSIQLNSLDARHFPNVYQNFFSDSRDYDMIINGLDAARKIFEADPIIFDQEINPGKKYNKSNIEELREYIYQYATNSIHAVGTIGMGSNASMYPVDSRCRLRGIDNLRIVDASIWPYSTNSGDMALVFMIAEKCTHHIIEDNKYIQSDNNWWNKNIQYIIIVTIIVILIIVFIFIVYKCIDWKKIKNNNNHKKQDELTLLNMTSSNKRITE